MKSLLFDISKETVVNCSNFNQRVTRQGPQSSDSAIIIDNGSFEFRAGWEGAFEPNLIFQNLVSKYRDRATGRHYVLVGNEINLDPVARTVPRSAFDGGLLSSPDILQHVFDYTFIQLGLGKEGRISRPIVLTEPLCQPIGCRKPITELLFEAYQVPSVAYGIDALYGYYYNKDRLGDTGMVLSSSHTSTVLIPILNGQGVLSKGLRLMYGGGTAEDYLLRLMQAKYPSFPAKMTLYQARTLLQNHTYVSQQYHQDVDLFVKDGDGFEEHIIQFPFQEKAQEVVNEEQVALAAERRKEQAQRLKEMSAKARAEAVTQKKDLFEILSKLKEAKLHLSAESYQVEIERLGFLDEADMEDRWRKTKRSLIRGGHIEDKKEKPSFHLLAIADSELDEDGKREKKRQKMLKANYDARERLMQAKQDELVRKEENLKKEELEFQRDPELWLRTKRAERDELKKRIKKRGENGGGGVVGGGGRRSGANIGRMQVIASLAEEAPMVRKKGVKTVMDDNFGANDKDWMVYREIQKTEEDEDEELQALKQCEMLLERFDKEFGMLQERPLQSFPLLERFLGDSIPTSKETMSDLFQLRMNVERIRVPEVLFRPEIVGLDQAGIPEMFEILFRQFNGGSNEPIDQRILLTGGLSLLAGLDKRLESTVQSILPMGSTVQVFGSTDPMLDAWRGAALWAAREKDTLRRVQITRAQYEEYGADYFIGHALGNQSIL